MTTPAQLLLERERLWRTSSACAADGRPLAQQIFFEADNWLIPDGFADLLEAHAAYLQAHPDLFALISGHSYGTGSHRFFWLMGERRAMAVRAALMKAGAEAEQLLVQSEGAARPQIEMAGDDVGHYRRRVSIDYMKRGDHSAAPPPDGSPQWWRSVMGLRHKDKLPDIRPVSTSAP